MQTQGNHIDDLEKMIYSLKRAIMLKSCVSSHYASFKNPEITLLLDINNISSPLDWTKVQILEARLAELCQISKSSPQFQKGCWLKLYIQILVACIVEENTSQGFIFLQKLLKTIVAKRDITETLQLLFQISSLSSLINYQIDENKEYKYDPLTQSLFFFILSQISGSQQQYLSGKCLSICERSSLSGNTHPLLFKIIESIKNRKKSPILQKLIIELIKVQRSFIVKEEDPKNIEANVKQTIGVFCNQKWGFNLNNCEEDIRLNNYTKKHQLLINIFELTNSQSNSFILQHLQKTSLIRKIADIISNKSKQQIASMKKSENLARKNSLLQRFKLCQSGMVISKCNYSTDTIRPRFVYFNQKGIFWGKQKSDCQLKHKLSQFRGVVYGKVTPNILQKGKSFKGSNIFSILLEDRSIDFVCQNYQQTIIWLQSLTYLISTLKNKKNQSTESLAQAKVSLTKGQILWKSLMMNLRREGQIGLGKAMGIIALKDQIHLKCLTVFMHEFN